MTVPITLNNVADLTQTTTAATTINNNSTAITTAFGAALDTAGDQMKGTLDMNSNQIINLPNPLTANSPARLQDLSTLNNAGTVTNIPSGGTTGQFLAKTSNANYAVGWGSAGTGSVTSVGLSLPADFTVTNSPVTTTGTLTGTFANAPTGSGGFVRATSPTLTTPNIGAATATTVNNTAITAPGSTATLAIASGKTATISNTLTLAGTDGTTQTFPSTSGTVVSSVTSAGGDLTGTYPSPTVAASAVTNTKMANMAAYTIKGNATGSAAAPTDVSIPALTLKSSPVSGDIVMISDSAASNALKYTTVGAIAAGGSVSSFNTLTGAVTTNVKVQTFVTPPATITVTIASPAVVTWTGHNLQIGSAFQFTTTGALPSPLVAGTVYFIISAGFGANSFEFSTTSGGSAVNTTGSQSGVQTGTPVYVPTSGMLHCIIECQAGGGGGGGVAGSTGATIGAGGGGGGAYSRKYSTAATIGASQVVTVGVGGAGAATGANAGNTGSTTSVGSICTCNGGTGGSAGSISGFSNGGAGGTAGTGDLSFAGGGGSQGFYTTGTLATGTAYGGAGGNSHFGTGGTTTLAVTTTTGFFGSLYGGGGAGGAAYNTTSTAAGGGGAAGIVVITEFVNV